MRKYTQILASFVHSINEDYRSYAQKYHEKIQTPKQSNSVLPLSDADFRQTPRDASKQYNVISLDQSEKEEVRDCKNDGIADTQKIQKQRIFHRLKEKQVRQNDQHHQLTMQKEISQQEVKLKDKSLKQVKQKPLPQQQEKPDPILQQKTKQKTQKQQIEQLYHQELLPASKTCENPAPNTDPKSFQMPMQYELQNMNPSLLQSIPYYPPVYQQLVKQIQQLSDRPFYNLPSIQHQYLNQLAMQNYSMLYSQFPYYPEMKQYSQPQLFGPSLRNNQSKTPFIGSNQPLDNNQLKPPIQTKPTPDQTQETESKKDKILQNRSCFHIAIAYNIYLENQKKTHRVKNPILLIQKKELDPTNVARRIRQNKNNK